MKEGLKATTLEVSASKTLKETVMTKEILTSNKRRAHIRWREVSGPSRQCIHRGTHRK